MALCVANNHREDPNNPFYKSANYIWQYQELEDWGDAFDYASKYEEAENNWRILTQCIAHILRYTLHRLTVGCNSNQP